MSRNVNGYINNISSVYYTMKKVIDGIGEIKTDADKIKQAVGLKMWKHSRHAAWVSQWDMLKNCIELAKKCGLLVPTEDSKTFQFLVNLNAYYAFVLREFYCRVFREKGKYWY